MAKRDAPGLKLLITGPLFIAGSYLLTGDAGDSLPVVVLVMIGIGVLFAHTTKFMFFSDDADK